MVTPSRTRVLASFTDTGSVVASATCRTCESGPTISTVAGSTVYRPTTKPGAGSPSIAGTTGTLRRADFSSSSASVAGTTCDTSTPNGARTSSVRMWKRREPDRAVLRSRTATISPDCRRLSTADDPRTRTSTVSGVFPTISSASGMLRNSSGTRRLRSTTCSPATVSHSSDASAMREDLQPEMAEGVVAHQP